MSLASNAASTAAAASAATAAADKTKMCASSLIFRATKWSFRLCDLLWGQWMVPPKPWQFSGWQQKHLLLQKVRFC